MNLPSFKAGSIVIGGGFYGVCIALYLAKNKGLSDIVLIEKEGRLLSRASYSNQARIHNGYHYPRSFTTAYRSRVNLPRFVMDWPQAVKKDFTKLYSIARNQSKVTSRQFRRFCKDINAPLEKPNSQIFELFNKRLIEDVFLAEEYTFDSCKLHEWALDELKEAGVTILYNTNVTSLEKTSLEKAGAGKIITHFIDAESRKNAAQANLVFNCTYSGLSQYSGNFKGTRSKLKHEITEMPLITMPTVLQNFGITVMDGPFFSMMPFPARGLHSLSHVRYTPHFSWQDEAGLNPYLRLDDYHKQTRVDRMMRDVERYIPSISGAIYEDSLFEIKTVLMKNEVDDGRPILFEISQDLPGLYSVLGGKIDNIYDILERLDSEI